jgi:hypothetical protein
MLFNTKQVVIRMEKSCNIINIMAFSQIFKTKIPNELLFILLEDTSIKNDKYYIVNKASFKKGVYEQKMQKFLEDCKPHYHEAKKKYVERKLIYNNFTTVLRQICKANNIPFKTEMHFDKSEYEIVYYVEQT